MPFSVCFILFVSAPFFPARAQDAFLQNVRYSVTDDKVRFVLDVNPAPAYKIESRSNVIVVTLYKTRVQWASGEPVMGAINDICVKQIAVAEIESESAQETDVLLTISLSYNLPYKAFQLSNPNRFVLDIFKQAEDNTVMFLQSSMEFSYVHKTTKEGLLAYYVLKFAPERERFTLMPSLADAAFAREKLSSIVAQYGAYAGINGSFFSKEGKLLGLVASNGNVFSENLFHRSCFVEKKSGEITVENVETEIFFEPDGGQPVKVDGLNRERKDGEIIVYTPYFGLTTQTNQWGREFVIAGGVVREVNDSSGNSVIPSDGYVLSASSKRLDAAAVLSAGEKVKILFHLKPEDDFENVLCAGPRLLKDGKVDVASKEEQFKKDVAEGKAPRTAVGITKDGGVLLVVIDGRNPAVSMGLTLQELAELLLDLGAYNAVNLDGGGSSTMVIGDKVVNVPSDGSERKIATALLLMADKINKNTFNEAGFFSELFQRENSPAVIFSQGH